MTAGGNRYSVPISLQVAIQVRERRAFPGRVKQILDVADLIRKRDRGAKS